MTRALVVGASPEYGSGWLVRELASTTDLVVAADAGARILLDTGVKPDICVGDMDSLDRHTLSVLADLDVRIERHPRDKDASDLDLAVQIALREGATHLTLTACGGGRPDHVLAAYGSLLASAVPSVIREPDHTVAVVRPQASLVAEAPAGTLLSIFAVGEATGVTIDGAVYNLAGATLAPLASRGLSNSVGDAPTRIATATGILLVLIADPHAVVQSDDV